MGKDSRKDELSGLAERLDALAEEGRAVKEQKKKRSVAVREKKRAMSDNEAGGETVSGFFDRAFSAVGAFFRNMLVDFKDILKTGRFKRGTAAFVLAVLFVALIVLLNLAAVALSDRYSIFSADLTANKIYTLSDVTLDLLENLDRRVEIDIIASETECYYASTEIDPYGHIAMATELIKRYEQQSENIKVEFIDIDQNPGFLDLVPDYRDSIDYYSIVVRSELRTRVTSFYEMLPSLSNTASTDGTNTDIASSSAETCISSLIKTVTISKVPTVAYIDTLGSGEYVEYLLNALYLNGYDIYTSENFALGYEAVPDEVSMLIIASPQYDLSAAQLSQLSDWLQNDGELGKTLMVLSSNLMGEMPNLTTLLEEWGLGYTRDTVYEGDSSMTLPGLTANNFYSSFIQSSYIDDDITTKPIVVSNALNIAVPAQYTGNLVVNGILCTSTNGRVSPSGEVYDASNYSDANGDLRYIMAQATLYKDVDDETQLRSDVILAPVSLCDSIYFSGGAFSNFALMMRVCNERCGIADENLNISAKSLTATDFSADTNTVVALTVVFGYVVPLALAALGLVVYLRRRRL